MRWRNARLGALGVGLLVLLAGAASQAQDDWEMPEEMKAKPCPAGEQRDGFGKCVPIPGAAKPAEAEKPAEPEKPAAPEKAAEPDKPAEVEKPAEPVKPAEPGEVEEIPAPAEGAAARPPLPPAPGEKAAEPAGEKPAPAPAEGAAARPPLVPPPAAQPAEVVGEKAAEGSTPEKPGAAEPETAEGEKTAEGDKAAEGEEEPPPPPQAFIKGELSSFIGSSKLVTKNNRIGVRLGAELVDGIFYQTFNPELDLRFGQFQFGLGVPLAIEIYDMNFENLSVGEGEEVDWTEGFGNAGRFRTEDWDEPSEYIRFIRYATWGKKEDHIFASLSQVGNNSLGHGALMRRYSANIDPNSVRVALQFDMYNDYAGFELMSNSIVDWDVFGALAFIKPLSFFLDSPIARSWSIGFTWLADRHAPVTLEKSAFGLPPVANPFYLSGENHPDSLSTSFLQGMGVDMEIKVLKTESVDLKPFVDFSFMLPGDPSGEVPLEPEWGWGFTAGLLGRFNVGQDPVHAFRLIAEFRSFTPTYLPGYFDTFYEVQKYLSNLNYADYTSHGRLPPTKFEDVFVERKGQDQRYGYYVEFNYSIVENLTLTLALEGSNADRSTNFLAHIEVPALSWLQFFASYHHRSMDGLGELFASEMGNRIIFAAVRLRVFPFLFINFQYQHTLHFSEGEEELTGDEYLDRYRYYAPAHGFFGDLEFGWEF